MPHAASSLVAVDIGNSRIKLGRFERGRASSQPDELPEPTATYELPISDRSGQFDVDRLALWSGEQVEASAPWLLGSVHRGAADRFTAAVEKLASQRQADWPVRRLLFQNVPLPTEVDQPERVGIDRLLAALAADRLRRRDRAVVVADLGSAMTIDFVSARGAFAGGAILPGISMSARALAEQTDALPRIDVDHLDHPPAVLGKSTVPAIEAGLYWGAVGAIREFLERYSATEALPPDLILTGGASAQLARLFESPEPHSDQGRRVLHVPHLVLAGIALVDQAAAAEA